MKDLSLLERIPESRWLQPWLSLQLFQSTPSQTIYREGSFRLQLYRAHETPARAQVLLFPSLINRPYVLDLGRGRSLIQALVRAGLEVALFDWGGPGEEERDMGLESLLFDRVPRALQSLHAHSEFMPDDPRPRTLIGHCLGGNLALLFASRAEGILRIDRIACLTTPIDTDNDALLNTWFRTPEWNPERFARSFQNIPWPFLQMSFQLQRPTMTPRRWLQMATHLTERDYRDSWLQMEIWSNDCISFSSELFRDLLIPMYRDNEFMTAKHHAWRAIRDIDLPVFSLVAKDDHIVPVKSAHAIREALPKAKHEVSEARGGHIGAVISKRTRETVWPKLIEFASDR